MITLWISGPYPKYGKNHSSRGFWKHMKYTTIFCLYSVQQDMFSVLHDAHLFVT